jgi:hypothetical protein
MKVSVFSMALMVQNGIIQLGDTALDPLDCEQTLHSLPAVNGLWEICIEYYGYQDDIAEICVFSPLYNPDIEEVYLRDLFIDSGMVCISSGAEQNTIDIMIDGQYPVYGCLDDHGRLLSIRIHM